MELRFVEDVKEELVLLREVEEWWRPFEEEQHVPTSGEGLLPFGKGRLSGERRELGVDVQVAPGNVERRNLKRKFDKARGSGLK